MKTQELGSQKVVNENFWKVAKLNDDLLIKEAIIGK